MTPTVLPVAAPAAKRLRYRAALALLVAASLRCAEGPTASRSPVAGITITPAGEQMLLIGQTLTASVTLTTADGREVTRPVAWSSRDPDIASVSATGVITGIWVGYTFVNASVDGITASMPLVVRASLPATIAVPAPLFRVP